MRKLGWRQVLGGGGVGTSAMASVRCSELSLTAVSCLSVCLSVAPLPEVWTSAVPQLLFLRLHLPPHGLRGPSAHVPGVQRLHQHRRVSDGLALLTPGCKHALPFLPLPSSRSPLATFTTLHPSIRHMTLSESRDLLVAVHTDDSVRVSEGGRDLGRVGGAW